MRGSRRPAKDRAKAVGIAMVAGIPEASKQTGIPMRSLRRYKDDPELAALGLSARDAVAESMWVGIQVGLDQVYAGLLSPDERLRDKADALFGLLEHHALLTGGVTSRSETKDTTNDLDNETRSRLTAWIDRRGLDSDAGAVDSVPEGASSEVREPTTV